MIQRELFPLLIDQEHIDFFYLLQKRLIKKNKLLYKFHKTIYRFESFKEGWRGLHKAGIISEIKLARKLKDMNETILERKNWIETINKEIESIKENINLINQFIEAKMETGSA